MRNDRDKVLDMVDNGGVFLKHEQRRTSNMEYVVWARKVSEPEYMESVITETKSLLRAEHDRDALESNGYIARIMTFNFEKPDFTGCIKI